MKNADSPDIITLKCDECGNECKVIEETCGYSATHCTNGIEGIHRTGQWYSDCCDAGYSEEIDQMDTFLLCMITFCIGYGLTGLWLAFKDSDK